MTQIRDGVVRPALHELGMWSPAAEWLVMGTGLTESKYRFRYQIKGPALGFYQCEPATFHDVMLWIDSRGRYKNALQRVTSDIPTTDLLVWNIKFATAICRLHYYRIREKLPDQDLEQLGQYWKTYYNTRYGRGTVKKFVSASQILKELIP
jgi:hypothetical protein